MADEPSPLSSLLTTLTQTVGLIPADRFFLRVVPVSSDPEAGSVAEQVELALEATAPFPLNQLYYGYWWSAGCECALAYAAYRKRFPAEENVAWSKADLVIPAFALLRGLVAPEGGTTWIVRETECLTALHFGEPSPVPTQIAAVAVPPETSPAQVSTLRDGLIRQMGGSRSVQDFEFPPELVPADGDDDDITFQLDGRKIVLNPTLQQELDVRDRDELRSRSLARQRDRWLWRGLVGIAAGIVLLACGELSLLGGRMWSQTRQVLVENRAPVVSEIMTKQSLALRIEDLQSQQLRPFEMIALVNQGRPSTVQFLSTRTDGLRKLIVEAKTSSTFDLNAYAESLKKRPEFSNAAVNVRQARDGVTLFNLTVTFAPDAFGPVLAEVSS